MVAKDKANVQVANLTKDLADCVAYGHVFRCISQNGLSNNYFEKQVPARAQ